MTKQQFTARIPRELYLRLNRRAIDQRRSVNEELVLALELAFGLSEDERNDRLSQAIQSLHSSR